MRQRCFGAFPPTIGVPLRHQTRLHGLGRADLRDRPRSPGASERGRRAETRRSAPSRYRELRPPSLTSSSIRAYTISVAPRSERGRDRAAGVSQGVKLNPRDQPRHATGGPVPKTCYFTAALRMLMRSEDIEAERSARSVVWPDEGSMGFRLARSSLPPAVASASGDASERCSLERADAPVTSAG